MGMVAAEHGSTGGWTVGGNEHAHRESDSGAHVGSEGSLWILADYLRPLTVLQAVLSALVLVTFTFIVEFAINGVTGGSLPGPLARYPWLAWPAVAFGFLVSVAGAIRERLRHRPRRRDSRAPSSPRAPKELPPDIPEFTGRRRELDALRALLPDPDADRLTAPTI